MHDKFLPKLESRELWLDKNQLVSCVSCKEDNMPMIPVLAVLN